MTKDMFSKLQNGEVKPSISDVNCPLPDSILVLVTVRKNDSFRTTEILTLAQACESFDADPVNAGVQFTPFRFIAWRQASVPEELIVAHSVAKLM